MFQNKNIPSCVLDGISRGICRVLVHAYVVNVKRCPRYFLVKGEEKQHSNNNKCVVMCTVDTRAICKGVEDYRMFVLCMSEKCKNVKNGRHGKAWLEVEERDV